MKELSTVLANMPASATLAVSEKAGALTAAGKDLVVLAGGDPDFDTPHHITQAAFAAIENGATHYPSPMKGIPTLLDAIAAKLERENNVIVDPRTDVVTTPGGKWSINLGLGAILNPGDEVLYFEPVWVSYPAIITLNGGVPVPIALDSADNFQISAESIQSHITPKTKVIMVNTPCNPTGRVMTQAEADAIAHVAIENDLYVLTDELYEHIVFDGHQHISLASLPGMGERTMTINGFSKAYAMTGWRMGWIAGPTPIMKLAAKMNGQTVSSAATFTMHAAIAALEGPQDAVRMMTQSYKERRDMMVPALNAIDGVECASVEGTFYLMPKFTNTTVGSIELADGLLDFGVASTPGVAFGDSAESHVRFSIATAMSELERSIERIAAFAASLG